MAVMDYRTQDGLAEYGFSIEFESDVGWRVYIIFQPFLQGHDDSQQLPYQSIDDRNGRRYVNWASKLDSMGEAKTVAELWAELIQRYQRLLEQGRATPSAPGRLGDTVGAGGVGPGHQNGGDVTPHPAAGVGDGGRVGPSPTSELSARPFTG